MAVRYTGKIVFFLLLTRIYFYFTSFAGIGLGKESGEELARKIKDGGRKARDRWTQTKVLIIDESKLNH